MALRHHSLVRMKWQVLDAVELHWHCVTMPRKEVVTEVDLQLRIDGNPGREIYYLAVFSTMQR
jgi:hypothetical protein